MISIFLNYEKKEFIVSVTPEHTEKLMSMPDWFFWQNFTDYNECKEFLLRFLLFDKRQPTYFSIDNQLLLKVLRLCKLND